MAQSRANSTLTPQQVIFDLVTDGFWRKVEKSDGCWLFRGALDSCGYGVLFLGKRHVRAHRLAYMLTHGEIREGLCVLHSCDVRNCVRPDHLRTGTHQENMRDMYLKGRHSHGCGVTRAKLNETQVVEIRQRYAAGGTSSTKLAKEYGVAQTTVMDIILRKKWKSVQP